MEQESMAALFSALRGGRMEGLQEQGDNLQMRVVLPKLAQARNEDFTFFYAVLSNCTEFTLQPFRNESTVISGLNQIERLGLTFHSAEPMQGNKVKVFCSHRGADSGARLTIRADGFSVYDAEFDSLNATELEMLRKSLGKDAED